MAQKLKRRKRKENREKKKHSVLIFVEFSPFFKLEKYDFGTYKGFLWKKKGPNSPDF